MLYTGKGDKGTTTLFACASRIAKNAPRIEALGSLDELNSHIGMCRACAYYGATRDIAATLHALQEDLFVLQASLAGAEKALDPKRLAFLEHVIANVELEIEPIHSFTIPGATLLSGALDVARTIARRAERHVVALNDASLEAVLPYLNRLSSVLFALARLAAHRAGIKEQSPHY